MVTTTTELIIDTGEKRDRLGRRVTPAKRRAELVREYQESGLTQAEFARREGVKYPTFAHWVQRTRKKEAPGKPLVQFAQVRLPTASAQPTPLEVRLPDGTIVRGNQAKDLAQLVRALRS